jgi:tripeptide aminopeptidase
MNLEELLSEPAVRAARAIVHRRDKETLDEQIRLVSIPAPTGGEAERGAYVRHRFEELGLQDLETDGAGNVLGTLSHGVSRTGDQAAPVLVSAHLDTIFPPGTEVRPRIEGERVFAPGITDNARGLAAILAIARALREADVATERPLLFVATVGEEGIGDLKGVKHLFREGSPHRYAEAFVSLDGAGLTRIVNQAIGARRLRARMKGLGGHSWGDRGVANPAHAIGESIARLGELFPPHPQQWSVTVGRLGGGTSVNSIPEEAWMEIDLRSDGAETLRFLERGATEILQHSLQQEMARSTKGTPLVLEIERIGDRPCGFTPPDVPLLKAACTATRLIGSVPELTASSTDANVPIALGIPALAMGAGGRAGGVHTLDEWFENHGGALGIERALLTVLAIAGVRRSDQVA